jgi:hypothetical protein
VSGSPWWGEATVAAWNPREQDCVSSIPALQIFLAQDETKQLSLRGNCAKVLFKVCKLVPMQLVSWLLGHMSRQTSVLKNICWILHLTHERIDNLPSDYLGLVL